MNQRSPRKKILLSHFPQLLISTRESILRTSQVYPLIASNTQEIMALVRIWQPDLLILGPDDIGRICRTLKSSKEYRHIPMIAIIAGNHTPTREEVLEAGCDEWLSTPLDESALLATVQDLIGIRFRKLPRLTFSAPALVSFKGKEFPSQTIDINRRMIFLESKEGLAPATGRNVKVRFQLTEKEPIICWGRVERLLTRHKSDADQETIGMLIRFLDLSVNAANRIETLALNQTNRIEPAPSKSSEDYVWLEESSYSEICQLAIKNQEDLNIPSGVVIPPGVLKAYISGLNDIEKKVLQKGDGTDSEEKLLKRLIAGRMKLLDDLNKIRGGAPPAFFEKFIKLSEELRAEAQNHLNELIQQNDSNKTLLWSSIKCELLRANLEAETLKKGTSTFNLLLDQAKAKHKSAQQHSHWKPFSLGVLLTLILVFFSRGINIDTYKDPALLTYDLKQLADASAPLMTAHVFNNKGNHWKVFHGQLNENWIRMSPKEREEYCQKLKEKLDFQGFNQILLYTYRGKLKAGIINDTVTLFQ